MKKLLIISSILAVLAGAVSCDMNLRPAGTIDPDNALQTIADAENFREGMYVLFRSTVGGSYASVDEIRSDLFHATSSFGNNGGTMYNWIQTADDGDASTLWANAYYVIADANFFLQKSSEVNTSEWSEEDRASLSVWRGEAYFLRAYYHMELAEKFCLSYVGNEQSFGVPYVTVYNPTSDIAQYPTRGTLEHTFEMILGDLDSAAKYVTTPGSIGSDRITSDAVTALRARIALEMGDYSTALDMAESLINRYPLTSGLESFRNMWFSDAKEESILQLYASNIELGASYDYTYLGFNVDKQQFQPYYLPEKWVIDLYEPSDIRFQTYFLDTTVAVAAGEKVPDIYVLYKFSGNPALRSGTSWNYQIQPKVFRIAEMYLIAAEASAMGAGADPMEYVNRLRTNRGASSVTPSADKTVMDIIMEERVREFIGEGFRIQDLKRMKYNLERGEAQNPSTLYQPDIHQSFFKSYADPKMLYPIPQAELDANPNMAGEQNDQY